MFDPASIPKIDKSELLARYVISKSHYRSSDKTVKPDLFMPHPHKELSVTRYRDATEKEIWAVGENVAKQRNKALLGKASISVANCQTQLLEVKEDALPGNPNHANIINWPDLKEDKKSIAQQLAALASKCELR